MLAGPLAALRLGLLTRGHPITVAARLSSNSHCAKFSSRVLRRARSASIIPSKTFCSTEIKTMAEPNGTTAASLEEVEALRKQVEDLKVNNADLQIFNHALIFRRSIMTIFYKLFSKTFDGVHLF